MIRVLLPLLALLCVAGPAAADPVSATLMAISATTVFGSTVTVGAIMANLLGGVAATALSRAMAPGQSESRVLGSIRTESTTAGGTQSQTVILGRYATGGCLLAPLYSFGYKGDGGEIEHLVMPIAVADYPIDGIESVIIDGEKCVFDIPSARSGGIFGNTCSEYDDRAFLRVHDGRQTAADSMLVEVFGSHPDRPWASTAVLRGVAYGVLAFKFDEEIWTGIPEARFVVRGARLYDPRKDTTAGGSGAQRWSDLETWTFSENPVVQIYNLLRGLTLADGTVYGLGVPESRLPLSTWSAAMNVCDEAVSVSGGGTRPRYRAGIEISVDQEPLDVIEEIGRACGADLVELAGEWRIAVGEPAIVSAYITDDDILITSPEEFEPFPTLSETINAVHASFPSPSRLWESTEASPLYNAAWEAEDGGRRLVADLDFSTVPYGHQVRALMRELARDNRRMRIHRLTLPPAYLSLVPLKTIAWTSSHNGYDGKLFEITHKSIDPRTLCSTLTLRERDPADYSPDMLGDAVLPVNPSIVIDNRTRTGVPGFAFLGTSTRDGSGAARRPALRIEWSPDLPARGLAYEVRTKTSGAELASGTVSDVVRGNILIAAGVLSATEYEARVKAVGGRKAAWSGWISATTPDLRLGESDIADSILTSVNKALTDADKALDDAAQALLDADAAQDDANTALENAALAYSEAEIAREIAQEGSDVDSVLARALTGGWAKNPTFRNWSGSTISNWRRTGAAYITKEATGWLYSTAVRLAAPGSTVVQIDAGAAAGQLNAGADLAAEYVVLNLMIEYVSGDLTAGRATVHWKTAGGSFTEGTWPLLAVPSGDGSFDALGVKPTPGIRQAVQHLVKRPASVATAADVRLTITGGRSSKANPLTLIVHAADLRAATEQEIDQTRVRSYADAAVSAYDTTLQGLLGAGAWSSKSVHARFNENEGNISDLDAVVVSGPNALAARMTTVEVRSNDGNLALNPQGSRLKADGTPADFAIWTSAWSTLIRAGDASAAMAACPAPYAFCLPADAASTRTAIVVGYPARIPVRAGDRFVVSYDWATGGAGGGLATVSLRARWYDAAGAELYTTGLTVTDATSATWQAASREMTVPANAASARFELYRSSGGSGNAYVTNLYISRIDKVLAGRLDAVIALKASAGNPALLELISTATGELLSSTARIKADNILLDGSVAARHLVVGDFANLVPDDQLQDLGSWTQNAGTWTHYPTSGLSSVSSVGEFRTPNSGSNALLLSEMFPVEPGEVYSFSFQCRRSGGTKMSAALRIYWYENDGTYISSVNAAEYSGTSTATLTRTGTLTAPSTASYAKAAFFAIAADTDSTIRFFAPKARRQLNAVEIKDGAIVADKLAANAVVADKIAAGAVAAATIAANAVTSEKIVAGAIETAHLAAAAITSGKIASDAITAAKIAANAITTDKIVAGTIETDRIKVGAVGRTFTGNSFASTSLDSTDKILLTWTMPAAIPESSALQVVFALGYDTSNGPNTTFKVKKNGTTQFENETNNNSTNGDRTMTYSTVISVGAGDVVTITGTKGSGSATMQFVRASLLVVMR